MSQIRLAVDGKTKSGVVVAQIRRSTSRGAVPVFFRRPRTASAPMCEVPRPFTAENMPFLDFGPLDDPLIVGVDHLRQIGVGQHILGDVTVNPGDGGATRGPTCDFRFFGLLTIAARHSYPD